MGRRPRQYGGTMGCRYDDGPIGGCYDDGPIGRWYDDGPAERVRYAPTGPWQRGSAPAHGLAVGAGPHRVHALGNGLADGAVQRREALVHL